MQEAAYVNQPKQTLVREVHDSLVLLFLAGFILTCYLGIALLLVEAVR
ncbi:MAG TPA: hypothetical protein VND22_02820 [Actinomycetota bacterium]|nr:hypothetical protein [Actinomycetota bacterium]